MYYQTEKGIERALRQYKEKLIDGNVSIYVRRGGPNYQEGLRVMRELGNEIEIINFLASWFWDTQCYSKSW